MKIKDQCGKLPSQAGMSMKKHMVSRMTREYYRKERVLRGGKGYCCVARVSLRKDRVLSAAEASPAATELDEVSNWDRRGWELIRQPHLVPHTMPHDPSAAKKGLTIHPRPEQI